MNPSLLQYKALKIDGKTTNPDLPYAHFPYFWAAPFSFPSVPLFYPRFEHKQKCR